MADYYEVLGLSSTADSTQIRMAYKRLAMQYHPDRNPGNAEAEEMFKTINEAYHVLSDPLKKSRYDSRQNSYQSINIDAYWREIKRQQYARWQYAQKKRYTFDRSYFKIQGLAFLVFLGMSAICFAIIHSANYFIDLQRQRAWEQKRKLVVEVNSLFASGQVDEAIERISLLHQQEPLEFQFSNARDSLVDELRRQADEKFTSRNFDAALAYYLSLKKYEFPPRTETLRKLGVSQFNAGLYEDALHSFKQLYHQQPWNVELVYQIGLIHYQYLGSPVEALQYFTIGKKMFRENLTEIYGEAFSVVMNPADVPDIYVEVFTTRAEVAMDLQQYKEAINDLNWVIFLRPQKAEPYRSRAIAKIAAKDYSLLCTDLALAKKLGASEVDRLQSRYCR